MALKAAPTYEDLAKRLIARYNTTLGHIDLSQVLVLAEDEKTPKKYAECRKIGYPYNYVTNHRFMLIFYEEVIGNMTQEQKQVLVLHELMHIDEDFERLRKHDVEDFSELLLTYGVGWPTDPHLVDILDTPAAQRAAAPSPVFDDEPS